MQFIALGSFVTALHQSANNAAAQLPLVGTKNPAAEIYLCHFSDNPSIQYFTADPLKCSWLNGFGVSGKKIGQITNINNVAAVNSLYVIRVGVNAALAEGVADVFPIRKSKYGVYEFALNLDVPETHFARIQISYSQAGDCFN